MRHLFGVTSVLLKMLATAQTKDSDKNKFILSLVDCDFPLQRSGLVNLEDVFPLAQAEGR